jgi:type I restriction enzyme, S subunit
MKSQNNSWIDKVPNKWAIGRISYKYQVQLGKMLQPEPKGINDIKKPYLRSANLDWNGVKLDDVKEMWFSPQDLIKYKIEPADILVSEGGDVGRSSFWDDAREMYIQNAVNRLRPITEESNPKFLFYWFSFLKTHGLIDIMCDSSTIAHYTAEKVKATKLVFPPIEEQTLIARFLDQKTSQIDQLIEQKERLLKLLAEKRTAIITQAVTKGLPAEERAKAGLDPDVEMKDSGIDWLGEIPKHWIPKRLKYLTEKIIDGTHSTPEYLSEGVPFLRVTDIVKSKGEKLDSDNFKFISEEEHQELIRRCNPEKGDLLYSKNGTIGIPRIVDWDFEFSIFVSLCLVKIKRNLLAPSFLSYSLQSKLTENQISIGSKKSAVINLHLDKIKEFVIPYPPMEEQVQINDWLNHELPKYKNSEHKLTESLERLKEYREALITAAVTGQIDVRKEIID